jgi:hypothetical protein
VNILTKQSWTADKGWSSSLVVGRWANNPSPKTIFSVTKCFKAPYIWTASLAFYLPVSYKKTEY